MVLEPITPSAKFPFYKVIYTNETLYGIDSSVQCQQQEKSWYLEFETSEYCINSMK